MKTTEISTDVLVIGGGTAGCYAAITLGRQSGLSVVVAEKADIRRSGCLAAGVNAINAYITEGHKPEDYAEYAKKDAGGIVRMDLLLTMSERLNKVTEDMEKLGLVILKDENGKYVSRGWRNIKINGENIKPILAKETSSQDKVTVLNHLNITDLLMENGRAAGAVGFSVREEEAFVIRAKAVLIATGGASGLYRPNNPGFSRHKMWYPPFNTGAGFAMGLRAGAEMTTFEMRFIALRCKDTIAPTGTIAQGVSAKQVNTRGEVYETKYGLATSERLYGTVTENREGRGPCYLRTEGISAETEQDLYKAYLNMAPSQTLKWMEGGQGPAESNVEIEGTEPYVVGGHTASGFWIDEKRATTIPGLYAAGDVAGGAPQKYVTGALVEGEIAAEAIKSYLESADLDKADAESDPLAQQIRDIVDGYESALRKTGALYTADQVEEAMQKIMDQYAGGIGTDYCYTEAGLSEAEKRIRSLETLIPTLQAADTDELLRIAEVKERLLVCRALIAHLAARKETRWHSFAENADHPEQDPAFEKYVNSKYENGEIQIIFRDLVTERRES